MLGLGWQELAIVLVIIVIIFGAGKLPDVMRSMGQGVKEFKQEAVGAPESLTAASSPSGGGFDTATSAQTAESAKVRADDI